MQRPSSILLLILCATLLTSSTPVVGASAPEGRTYFIRLMGLNGDPYEASADCLTFEATQACSLDGQVCLTWQATEGGRQTNKEFGLSFAAEIDDDGLIINLEGQGRVDSRGRRSSISMVGRAAALDVQVNFAAAGRQVGRSRCLRMVEDFYDAQTAER